jgi:dihydroflavonol-4-reductase
MPGFVDTGLNLCHVDDVAAGHLLALRNGRIGERYILGGENVMLADMLGEIAALVGRRRPTLRLPLRLVYPLAMAAEGLARVTGRTPFITREGLRLAEQPMFYADDRARRDLGYLSRPWSEGLADALAWFRAAGYVPASGRAA